MGGLIWVIIIIVFIVNINKKKAENTQKTNKKNTYSGTTQTNINNQTYTANQAYTNKQTYTEKRTPAYTSPSQEELKAKLSAKYGDRLNHQTAQKAATTGTKQETKAPDILAKANQNANQYVEDELHEAQCGKELTSAPLHAEAKKEASVDMENSSLMKDIEDLMVTGYQVNLEFGRDFLGEAMDMLNSYTMTE